MAGSDCAAMCSLVTTHTHAFPLEGDQYEWHRMSRMTATDCAIMCNLINVYTLHSYIDPLLLGGINASNIE